MTYVTDQTSEELRQHMKRLTNMQGWCEPLSNRLWKEIQEQDKIKSDLLEALKEIVLVSQLTVSWSCDDFENAISKAESAIAKAKGEKQ
jgi:hypothetical protein